MKAFPKAPSTTDDLPEGSANEYYTDAKVDANASVVANSAKVSADGSVTSHNDVTDAGSGAIITSAERADIGVAIKTDEAGEISALTEKGAPAAGDWLLLEDSENSNVKRKVQVGNLGVGGGSGVTDHGALTGLTDDDHSQYHTDGRADTWLATKDTDDIAEGSNLYYTEARVNANSNVVANTAKVSADGSVTSHNDVTDAGSGAIITSAERSKLAGIEAGAEVNPASTTEVPEGSNLYYTEARVNANSNVVANTAKVSADGSVTSHNDVTDAGSGAIITSAERATLGTALQPGDDADVLGSGAAADGHVLTADGAGGVAWEPNPGGGGVTDHGALTGLTDDDHSQYHTDGRADTWLATKDTDDIAEGSNLYYTEARVNANSNVVANTAKVSADGSVTSHNDVTDAGSGAIITSAERSKLAGIEAGAEVNPTSTTEVPEGSNLYYTEARVNANSNVVANTAKVSADGSVTSHNDVTDAGSGAIITSAERSKLAGIEAGAEVNPTTLSALNALISDATLDDASDHRPSTINVQTGTTYTLVAGDTGKTIVCTNAAGCTVTVPDTLTDEFECIIFGTQDAVTFAGSGSMTVDNRQAHTASAGAKAVVGLKVWDTNLCMLFGDTA